MKSPRPAKCIGRLTPSLCPTCGSSCNYWGDFADANSKPGPGDFTICFGCTDLLVFTAHMKVRKPTDAELATIDEEQLRLIEDTRAAAYALKRQQREVE